jgi:ferredoxin-type protein NapH
MSILSPFRKASQLFGLLMANLHVAVIYESQIYQGVLKSVCLPFLYCHSCPTAVFACPLGVMQYAAGTTHSIPFLLVGGLMIVGLLCGRLLSGWICPVGLFQEVLYKIKSVKITLPRDPTFLPYVIFIVLIVVLPFITTEHWFSKLCPVGTLTAGIPWVLWNPVSPSTGDLTIEPGTVGFLFVVKLIILGIALWLFVSAKRPFCRYICPMGLFWSFFNKVSIMKMEVDDGCTKCDVCRKKCPEDIRIYEDPNARDCIRCLECTDCKHVKVIGSLPIRANGAVIGNINN